MGFPYKAVGMLVVSLRCVNLGFWSHLGKCITKELIYQATVTGKDNMKHETYVGLTENTFKTRYSNHIYKSETQIRNRTEQAYLELERIRHPILNQMENNQAMQTLV